MTARAKEMLIHHKLQSGVLIYGFNMDAVRTLFTRQWFPVVERIRQKPNLHILLALTVIKGRSVFDSCHETKP